MELSFHPSLYLGIILTMGLSWTIVYLLVIYRSFKDKMCGMPFIALAFNTSWEFLYSFVFPMKNNLMQNIINRVWFGFDVLICISFFLYGARNLKQQQKKWFPVYIVAVFAAAYSLLYSYHVAEGLAAMTYSAFITNMVMSALFIDRLLKQRQIAGQSAGIAFFKMLGTLAASLVLLTGYSAFLQITGLVCLVLDVSYIVLLYRLYQQKGLSFFSRKKRSTRLASAS